MKNTVALTVRHEVWMTPATPGQLVLLISCSQYSTITHTDAMMQPNMIRYEKNSHALLHAAACPSPVLVYAL